MFDHPCVSSLIISFCVFYHHNGHTLSFIWEIQSTESSEAHWIFLFCSCFPKKNLFWNLVGWFNDKHTHTSYTHIFKWILTSPYTSKNNININKWKWQLFVFKTKKLSIYLFRNKTSMISGFLAVCVFHWWWWWTWRSKTTTKYPM